MTQRPADTPLWGGRESHLCLGRQTHITLNYQVQVHIQPPNKVLQGKETHLSGPAFSEVCGKAFHVESLTVNAEFLH